jgi:two-component system sensor histidine kinase YesM
MRKFRDITLFPNLKMRERILVTFLPVIIVSLSIYIILYSVIMKALEKQILRNNFQTLVMISNDIFTSLDRMENSVSNIIKNNNIQRYLYSDTSSNSKTSVRSMFTRMFNYAINTSIPYSRSAYLIKDEEDYIYVGEDSTMTEDDISEFVYSVYSENYNIYSSKYLLPTRESFKKSGVLHYIMPVPNLSLVTTQKSFLVINVSPIFITNIFYKYHIFDLADSIFTVCDYNGNLVCSMPEVSSQESEIPQFTEPPETGYFIKTSDKGDMLVMNMRMDVMGWVTTITVPLENILAPAKPYRNTFLLLIIISIVIFLLLIQFPTRTISNRLHEMCQTMEEVKSGKLSSRFPVKYHDEISVIGIEFNNMIDSIQNLQLNISELNLRQREAELQALQSQINPHFLYNTLECIRMVALENECGEAATQIKTLSDTFRYTISLAGLNKQVYIYQEMAHVYDYLTIQSFRFNDRYEVQIDVDDEILNFRTLKLILQPIIENAFTHGVRPMKKGGKIVMTGRREGDIVCFTISDNGVGMSKKELDILREEIAASPYEPRSGSSIGITNVSDRLKLSFGEQYSLKIDSLPGKGTTVTIKFPVINEAVDDAC